MSGRKEKERAVPDDDGNGKDGGNEGQDLGPKPPRKMKGNARKGKKAKKETTLDDVDEVSNGSERKPKTKRHAAPRAPTPYHPPEGSRYRLLWNEYFLDLPQTVTYQQYAGWQQVLDCIPSGQLTQIRGDHVATDPRLPPGTTLRNIPSLPDWIPKTLPIIVLQAFLYSNTGATWGDIVKRMGHTWDEFQVKQMYKINNKYSTAAGRWRNLIGVPSREPRLRPGQTRTTGPGSVNYASITWDDYVLLPPHRHNSPPSQAPQIPHPSRATTTAATATTRTRRKARSSVRTGPEDVASAQPYYGPSSSSTVPGSSSAIQPNGEDGRATSPSPYYLQAPSQRANETAGVDSAGLRARYAVLSEQELIARVMARTAAREREATRARIEDEGVPLDPALVELDRLLEHADSTAFLPSFSEQAAEALQPSSVTSPTTVPQLPTSTQPISPLQRPPTAPPYSYPSPPEFPLSTPSAFWDPYQILREVQERNDELVHSLPAPEVQSQPDFGNPPDYSLDEWEQYFQIPGFLEEPQEEIGGEELDMRLFDNMVREAISPAVGWDSHQQFTTGTGSTLIPGPETTQVPPSSISATSVNPEDMYNAIRQYLDGKNEVEPVATSPLPGAHKGVQANPRPSSKEKTPVEGGEVKEKKDNNQS